MLIGCVAYQDGKKLGDISVAQIQEYLHRPRCFVWVALNDPSSAELSEMQTAFELHPLAVEDALLGHQRPKIEEYGDSLFAVLHLIEPSGGEYHVGELAVFAGPDYVVSVRSHAQKGFSEVRARCEREPRLLRQGPGYVLYAFFVPAWTRNFPTLPPPQGILTAPDPSNSAPAGPPPTHL